MPTLPQADDVGGEARDVVHPAERPVLSASALEEDRDAPLNVNHRAIAKLDYAADAGVQVGEGRLRARHVVGGAGVEDSPNGLPLMPIAELNEEMIFLELDGECLTGVAEHTGGDCWGELDGLTSVVASISMDSSTSPALAS